ncbi:hypothetical protein HDE_08557 [Halotydeus destructor]|nr:hypothetical protein HDE_08557 [Halotydeus destructor]
MSSKSSMKGKFPFTFYSHTTRIDLELKRIQVPANLNIKKNDDHWHVYLGCTSTVLDLVVAFFKRDQKQLVVKPDDAGDLWEALRIAKLYNWSDLEDFATEHLVNIVDYNNLVFMLNNSTQDATLSGKVQTKAQSFLSNWIPLYQLTFFKLRLTGSSE